MGDGWKNDGPAESACIRGKLAANMPLPAIRIASILEFSTER
jgi:hypothetical protein